MKPEDLGRTKILHPERVLSRVGEEGGLKGEFIQCFMTHQNVTKEAKGEDDAVDACRCLVATKGAESGAEKVGEV